MSKKVNRTLIGFDIRLYTEYYLDLIWDHKRRNSYLLRRDLKWPMSVDKMVWPSIFRYSEESLQHDPFELKGMIDVIPDSMHQIALELWPDLEEMKAYFLKRRNKLKEGLQIAVFLEGEESWQSDEYWRAVLDPRLDVGIVPKGWSLLGYDVADKYMVSGLSNCGYNPEDRKELRNSWSDRLNGHGLLKTLGDAMLFKNITDQRVPEHKPFFVYTLFHDSQDTQGWDIPIA